MSDAKGLGPYPRQGERYRPTDFQLYFICALYLVLFFVIAGGALATATVAARLRASAPAANVTRSTGPTPAGVPVNLGQRFWYFGF